MHTWSALDQACADLSLLVSESVGDRGAGDLTAQRARIAYLNPPLPYFANRFSVGVVHQARAFCVCRQLMHCAFPVLQRAQRPFTASLRSPQSWERYSVSTFGTPRRFCCGEPCHGRLALYMHGCAGVHTPRHAGHERARDVNGAPLPSRRTKQTIKTLGLFNKHPCSQRVFYSCQCDSSNKAQGLADGRRGTTNCAREVLLHDSPWDLSAFVQSFSAF